MNFLFLFEYSITIYDNMGTYPFLRNFCKKLLKIRFPAVSSHSSTRFELPASKLVEISRLETNKKIGEKIAKFWLSLLVVVLSN